MLKIDRISLSNKCHFSNKMAMKLLIDQHKKNTRREKFFHFMKVSSLLFVAFISLTAMDYAVDPNNVTHRDESQKAYLSPQEYKNTIKTENVLFQNTQEKIQII